MTGEENINANEILENRVDDINIISSNTEKYDITLEFLKEEYFQSIESVRQVEEKANKYLVILTIVFTGFFTLLASSLTDKLKFVTKNIYDEKLISSFSLSYIFLLFMLIGFYYSIFAVKNLLKCLDFYPIHRLPNMNDALIDLKNETDLEYKKTFCKCLQDIIIKNHKTTQDKQGWLQKTIHELKKMLVFFGISMLLLLTVKFF